MTTGRRTRAPSAKTLEREKQVLEWKQEGKSFAWIAHELGLFDKGGAHRVYRQAMARVHQPAATEIRELQNLRLESLVETYWPLAVKGDYNAASVIFRTMERSAKLNGTDHEHGIAERALALEADRIRLIAVAFGKALDRAGLTAAQREGLTRDFLTELRARVEEDDVPDDEGSPDAADAVVDEEGRPVQ